MIINANKIDEWANSSECRYKLPLLIRKLIYGSIDDLSKCKFPALEQVSSPGFDGVVVSDESTQYIPKGKSVWEMGCNKAKKDKADKDYEKRKENPLNVIPEETVYIQVSSRKWRQEDIDKWCSEKKEENFWKDVRLYDAKDLEEWINNIHSVKQWFAEELGFPIENVETLEHWWERWSNVNSNVKFSSKLILTNKENETSELLYSLKNLDFSVVKSSTIEESIAFFYSVIDSLSCDERQFYLNKVLIVADEKSFDFYSQFNLILVPTFDYMYVYTNCFILIPVTSENTCESNITLKDPNKIDFAKNLEEIGFSHEIAKRYSDECGGNITILRRILSPKSQKPSWFDENIISVLITLFIIESWDENNHNDVRIIENISGFDYKVFLQKIMVLLNKKDTPLIKNDNKWILKSPKEIFFIIAPYLTIYDIENIKESYLKIFKVSKYGDKILDMNYSINLKRGIAKSLIIITLFGHVSNISYHNINTVNLMEEIFEGETELFWIINSQFLPLFAETSPEYYINIIKDTLKDNKENIECLFRSSNYTHILWSLELLSWDMGLFNDVVDILIELNKINYENRLYNSPFNTLKELFILREEYGIPYLKLRLNKLDEILRDDIEIGWELIEFLLSPKSKISMGIKKPKFRDYNLEQHVLKTKDIIQYTYSLEEKSLAFIGDDINKYLFLLDYYVETQNIEYKEKVLKIIENYDDSQNNVLIWNKLRDVLSIIIRIKNNEKFSEDEIEHLKRLYAKFEPKDLIKKSGWVFNDYYVRTLNEYEGYESIKYERKKITSKLIQEQGFDGVKELIKNIKLPKIFAEYVSEYEFDDEVLELL